MTTHTNITQKGQITIPIKLREKYNLQPGGKAAIVEENGEIKIKPVKTWNDYYGAFKSTIKYDKKAAQKLYIPKVIAGEL